MAFWRKRSTRTSMALAVLVGLGILLGLGSALHHHDNGCALDHCDACRLASATVPALWVLLTLVLTLPDSGLTVQPAHAFHSQTARRHRFSRGPPLV